MTLHDAIGALVLVGLLVTVIVAVIESSGSGLRKHHTKLKTPTYGMCTPWKGNI